MNDEIIFKGKKYDLDCKILNLDDPFMGAQGVVYKVACPDKGNEAFALKVYNEKKYANLTQNIIMNLQYYNVHEPPPSVKPTIPFDVGEIYDGNKAQPAAIMNFIDGYSLEETKIYDKYIHDTFSSAITATHNKKNRELRYKWVREILRGVFYLLKAYIVHLDLFPPNIMFSKNLKEIFIIDIDGSGIWDSTNGRWREKPATIGHSGYPGLPRPANKNYNEYEFRFISFYTTRWDVTALVYTLLFGIGPFEQFAGKMNWNQIQEFLMKGNFTTQEWPLEYNEVKSKINVTKNDYENFKDSIPEYLRQYFYKMFVDGMKSPKNRPRIVDLISILSQNSFKKKYLA